MAQLQMILHPVIVRSTRSISRTRKARRESSKLHRLVLKVVISTRGLRSYTKSGLNMDVHRSMQNDAFKLRPYIKGKG